MMEKVMAKRSSRELTDGASQQDRAMISASGAFGDESRVGGVLSVCGQLFSRVPLDDVPEFYAADFV